MRHSTEQLLSAVATLHPSLTPALERGPLVFSAQRRSRSSRRSWLVVMALALLEVIALVAIYLLAGAFFPQ